MQEQHRLQVELDIQEDLHELDDQTRVLLFQAVRELLFNVVKHAETSQATVRVEKSARHARIVISDGGKGFDAEAIMNSPNGAHGLLIIQNRLSLIGGSMEVTSKPGQGCRIVIQTPLESALS
jgi:signal transduction histidine kinase